MWTLLRRAPRPPPGNSSSWSHGKPTLTRQLRKWSPKLCLAVDCRHWFQNSEWFNQIPDNEPQGGTMRLSHEQETRRWWRQRRDLRGSASSQGTKEQDWEVLRGGNTALNVSWVETAPHQHCPSNPFMEVPAAHLAHPTKGGKIKGCQA